MKVGDKLLANAIRSLTIDAIEKSQSGHPGMPMGFADIATILFKDFLNFSAGNPNWPNRDRFILSAGHGSMLLYSLLYLTGYDDITLDDIKNFRQLGCKAAGHPEVEMLEGVETTTGPLGQGVANAVGMAISERFMNAKFPDLINHYTYVVAGDGCLMEGISQEAIALAGHLKLNKLILLFDDNDISIDGSVRLATSENQKLRFEAAGWNVLSLDGHNYNDIRNILAQAKNSDKPVMISCKTIIAYGSPNKSGTSASHGSPLGKEEALLSKEFLEIKDEPFSVSKDVKEAWENIGSKGDELVEKWYKNLETHDNKNSYENFVKQDYLAQVLNELDAFKKDQLLESPKIATRQASGKVIDLISKTLPNLIGGSADLSGSNNTKSNNMQVFSSANYSGNYIHYGVREHGMCSIMNGISLYGNLIPYAGTFLVFSDYSRAAIRLSALMEQRVIYVFTHDSIGLGEDGPTHQPVEHLDSLRLIPNLVVFRPCDMVETIEAWQYALSVKNRPFIFSLTRQSLPALVSDYKKENISSKGGYVISSENNQHMVTIIASGSEVEIAIAAKKDLEKNNNLGVRVVSMPSITLFDEQDDNYKNQVIGSNVKVFAIEASRSFSYLKYADEFIGMESFGASGKAVDLYNHFGITKENLCDKILRLFK
ncbi:MAG: transketolase [Rickettsiales bacterium]|nr:transketolase [Rickettsiales bacterium]